MSTPILPVRKMSDSGEERERRWRRSTLARALACLADPPTLAAIGLLLFNDHVFKEVMPSWLTGKLSDAAGLYFFPFLVLAVLGLLELALSRRFRSPSHAVGVAVALSGLWFLALKATPISNTYAVALLDAITGRANQVIADPTDLIALAMLPLAWYRSKTVVQRWESQSPIEDPRRRRWLRFIVLALASFASLATPAQVYPVNFGVVFDVSADPQNGDILYASLATQRIVKIDRPEGRFEYDHASRVSEVEHTVEVYRSLDGGQTWELYLPVGGYLWADPHTPDRLYVLNTEGLYRVDGGQARLLDVPFEAMQVELFPSGNYYLVDVLPNGHALAFDPITPDVLYLADGARVLISADAGETWRPLAAGDAPASVTALAVVPSAPQILYAGAGNRVLRSDDGGDSWSRTVRVGSSDQIRALAIHPETPEIVYAAGNGVFRSTDGGMTWRHVYAEDDAELRAIVLHPEHPNLVYAAGHRSAFGNYGQAVFSDDGGDTWESYGDRLGYHVAVSPVAPHRVILALGNEGVAVQESLQALPTPTPRLGLGPSDVPTVVYADALSFDPGDPTVSYALVSDPPALGRSNDGGGSWTVHPLTSTMADPPVALAAHLVSPTLRQTQGRLHPVSPTFPISPTLRPAQGRLYPVSPTHPASLTLPISPTYPVSPTIFVSSTIPVSTTGTYTSLVALGSQTVYSLTWRVDGIEIESFSLPDGGAAAETRPLLTAPSAPNLLLTTGSDGILRSDDGGQTWTVHALSPTTSLSQPTVVALSEATVSVSQSVTVYAAADAQDGGVWEQIIFRSQDGGRTWEPRSRLTGTHRLKTLAVHPTDPDIVYGGGTGLYQSGDGGATWMLLYPDIVVRALAIVPGEPRLLYAITDRGAARSDDGGLTWAILCAAGQVDGPAEFLGITIAPVEPFDYGRNVRAQDKPHLVVLLAHPTRPDLNLPATGTCRGLSAPQYDLGQGWQQSSEGLPVFFEEVRDW